LTICCGMSIRNVKLTAQNPNVQQCSATFGVCLLRRKPASLTTKRAAPG
jgi:hypothetical protein